MSKNAVLSFAVIVGLIFLTLGYLYVDSHKKIDELDKSLQMLSTDAVAFGELKYFNNDKRSLEKTLEGIKKFVPSISIIWSPQNVSLEQKNISKDIADKIIFSLVQQGHLIIYQKIVKQSEGFDIVLKVSP